MFALAMGLLTFTASTIRPCTLDAESVMLSAVLINVPPAVILTDRKYSAGPMVGTELLVASMYPSHATLMVSLLVRKTSASRSRNYPRQFHFPTHVARQRRVDENVVVHVVVVGRERDGLQRSGVPGVHRGAGDAAGDRRDVREISDRCRSAVETLETSSKYNRWDCFERK